MTTGTDVICPHCKDEIEITTTGFFGGILTQMFAQSVIDRAKREGAVVTCGSCKGKFNLKPQK